MAKDFLTTFKADRALCTSFEFDMSDLDKEDQEELQAQLEEEFAEAAQNKQSRGDAQLPLHKKVGHFCCLFSVVSLLLCCHMSSPDSFRVLKDLQHASSVSRVVCDLHL